MIPDDDLYSRLGVEPGASPEAIHQAYRAAARRFHPDSNPHPGAQEELKKINRAHEILGSQASRELYDMERARRPAWASVRLLCSRKVLPALSEPQVVYALVELTAPEPADGNIAAPPVNLCLVIDRSTSMQGARLDQVKASAQQIITRLRPQDTLSVVTFSDRAEVVIPALSGGGDAVTRAKLSTVQAGGGTEILQGLALGLVELRQRPVPGAIHHLTLLTDGRTYGDEDASLDLARAAAEDGIRISCLGIGEERNDSFLDELAGTTGAQAIYLDSPGAISEYFAEQARAYEGIHAQQLLLRVAPDRDVQLQSAFNLYPEPQPAPDPDRIRLGNLKRGLPLGVLLQFLVPPQRDGDTATLARLWLSGKTLAGDSHRAEDEQVRDLKLPVVSGPPRETPPLEIVNAMGKLTLYRMQEKARAEVERGEYDQAGRRLRAMATHLLASGEAGLSRAALAEAEMIERPRHLSAGGAKRLKYGTRALLSPPRSVL